MEYRFFEEAVPYYSKLDFFQGAPHVPPVHQVGHAERHEMYVRMLKFWVPQLAVRSISDLGCGDGSLMGDIKKIVPSIWGYDAGAENLTVAKKARLDARYADIVNDELEYGDLSTCCEVVEHLVDPRAFIEKIQSRYLLISSPSAEVPEWHYLEHAWGWDFYGYRDLVTDCGFTILDQANVTAKGRCDFLGNGISRNPQFQTILAERCL